jgi:hypothetical protein
MTGLLHPNDRSVKSAFAGGGVAGCAESAPVTQEQTNQKRSTSWSPDRDQHQQ